MKMTSLRKDCVYCKQEIEMSDKNGKSQVVEITGDYRNCIRRGDRMLMAHVLARQSLQVQFPMQVKVLTEQETKEYHLKRLSDLSIKSLREVPQLVEPIPEQKQWVLHRLKQPVEYWQRSFVCQHFTQEQKAAIGLNHRDISGTAIK